MSETLPRRSFLALLAGGAAGLALAGCGSGKAQARDFPVSKSEAEWKRLLTAQQYRVLREEATERPYSSPLDKEKRAGVFACAGCATPVYSSKAKFDSGTGWPSFWQSLPKRVATSRDFKLGYPRTEVHCATCGGHLGHIFDDGPPPTGKRHCINGVALTFKPSA